MVEQRIENPCVVSSILTRGTGAMLVGLVKIMLFMSFLGGSVFSLQVYDTYDKVKATNPNVRISDIIKTQGSHWIEKVKGMAQLEKQARSGIKKIAMGEVKKAIKMYYLDHNNYPSNINELVGEYLEKDTDIIGDPSFYYRKLYNGYKVGVTLETGENYEITN